MLEKLKGFYFVHLVPGHGAVQTDREYLDAMTALITDTQDQVTALAKSGASLETVRATVDLSSHAKRMVGHDPWRLRWFQRYWTEPFVATAYKEAKGEPISQSE